MEKSPFVQDLLRGKVALVTGGTSGIGFEISRQIGLHGCKVAICGRRRDVLDAAVAQLKGEDIDILGLQGDVRSAETCASWVRQLEEQWGGLDVLVNCAAGNFLARAEALSPNGFKTVMEIDALGTFAMSRAAFPVLRRAAAPCIINISATLQYGATWWQVHACAAKSAVDSMTRCLALEWGEFGIRVNGIAPGPIRDTAGVAKLLPLPVETNSRNEDGKTKSRAPAAMYVPLKGEMGTKWDIAMAAVFLASAGARFISGDTLVVDGASWLWREPVVSRDRVDSVSRAVEPLSQHPRGTPPFSKAEGNTTAVKPRFSAKL